MHTHIYMNVIDNTDNFWGDFSTLFILTCVAENTSILAGYTVVNSQPIVLALCEVCFISSAANIVQQNKA